MTGVLVATPRSTALITIGAVAVVGERSMPRFSELLMADD